VLVSIVLGAVIVVVGLQFRSAVQSAQDTVVGGVLIATGVGFTVLELSGRGHGHDHHHDDPQHDLVASDPQQAGERQRGGRSSVGEHQRGHLSRLAAVMVPFGAAASPDLTILPVFLAAAAAGAGTAVGSLLIFATVTVATIVGLTIAATIGALKVQGEWPERWGNAFTALILVLIGALVLGGVI